MTFESFIKRGLVRKTSKDIALIKSLISTAENDLKFLSTLKINESSARKIMVNYYDTLRSLIEAIALIDGYKVYSHEAFTDFFKEKKEEIIANNFDRFRKIRNGINYYGNNISPEETKENINKIKDLIKNLKEKYLKEGTLIQIGKEFE